MSSNHDIDDYEDDDIENDSIILHMNEKGELEEYHPVTMDEKDFKKLNKGLKLLRKKYPKISKECFGED